jgi:hypothetical protein
MMDLRHAQEILVSAAASLTGRLRTDRRAAFAKNNRPRPVQLSPRPEPLSSRSLAGAPVDVSPRRRPPG